MAEHALREEPTRPGITAESVRRLSHSLGEDPATTENRLRALRHHDERALPDRVRHLWRYTDPGALVPPADVDPFAPVELVPAPEPPDGGGTVVLQPGGAALARLSPRAALAGIRVMPLSGIAGDLARLGTLVPADHGVFEALNSAAWNAGLAILVPDGVSLAGPLHVIVPASGRTGLPRLFVQVGEGARIDLVEEHLGGQPDARVFGVTEIHVARGARLRHVLLQAWSEEVRGHLTHRTLLERDAESLTVVSSLGGRLYKADLGVVLAGEGARSEIVGMALGERRQHLDLHTEHHHLAGRTRSDMDIRAALAGRARATYTGLIRIEQDAPACEAFQKNRNLLLSPRARAETIPELEILNADVTCTHGATASPVEAEPMFYLQSRGIAPDEAAQLVVRGFFEPILAHIPEPLRGGVSSSVEGRVARLRGVRG